MMDPQQELFTELRKRLIAKFGESKVFDGFMPPDDTPYPFIYLAENYMTDVRTKSKLNGRVVQTIHVWHNSPTKRGTASTILSDIKNIIRALEHDGTANYGWIVQNVTQRILTDNTTKTPLLHGILEVELYFS